MAETTQKEYLDKMAAHTTCAKHSLGLNMMLGEKKVELNGREWDLNMREAVLTEAQTQGINPWDNHEELIEFIELWRLLHDAKVDCVTEDGRLMMLVRDVFKVLVDLAMPPILGIT
jgi:hypothetical protein